MEEIKLEKKAVIKVFVLAIVILTFSILGVTYAYFGWQIEGNEEASSLTLLSRDLQLEYNDVQISMGSNEYPGWSDTKTIVVRNTGSETALYNFIWRELYNTIQKGDLVIRATCSSNKGGCANLPEKKVRYTTDVVQNSYIHGPFSIASGETQTYTLTIEYKETGSDQRYNNGASFHGTINIGEGAETHPLYSVMQTLAQAGDYASTYSGTSNDSYGRTGNKTIYYIKPRSSSYESELLNKINVKFAGMCWQILRTTDTGGVKLIYNGEYVEGTGCYPQTDTEHTHKGIIGTNAGSTGFGGMFKYSDTFTYNISTGEFTLVNPIEGNYYSDKSLLRKYSCRSSASTCTTLYYLNYENKSASNIAYCTAYTIGDTQNAQIGTSPFYANYYSPAYVGYMFGDTAYEYVANTAPSGIMGNKVHWNGSNYELQESDGTTSSNSTYDTNHHYMCNNGLSTCADGKVRYYYYGNYYTELTGGDDIEAAISKMLTNVENKHDSTMKAYLENWYYNNLRDYEDYIDQDAVYCNDRSITSLGGWSNTGPITADSNSNIKFNNYIIKTTLGCTNNTDKFSTSNTSAQLKYPIGLATAPEMKLINNDNVRKTGQYIWLVSPDYFSTNTVNEHYVFSSGGLGSINVNYAAGSRPVITLAPTNVPVTGNGSLSNPYVIN